MKCFYKLGAYTLRPSLWYSCFMFTVGSCLLHCTPSRLMLMLYLFCASIPDLLTLHIYTRLISLIYTQWIHPHSYKIFILSVPDLCISSSILDSLISSIPDLEMLHLYRGWLGSAALVLRRPTDLEIWIKVGQGVVC